MFPNHNKVKKDRENGLFCCYWLFIISLYSSEKNENMLARLAVAKARKTSAVAESSCAPSLWSA